MDRDPNPIESDRLSDLESQLISLQVEIRSHQRQISRLQNIVKTQKRNTNAIALLCLFLVLLTMIGAKYRDEKWEWELEENTVSSLINALGISAAIGGGAYLLRNTNQSGKDD